MCSSLRFPKSKPVRMTSPVNPSSPKPAGDDRNLVPVDLSAAMSFEDKLEAFWEKNRGLIIGGCVIVVIAIAGNGLYGYLQKQKKLEVQKAYAAATTTEQLKSFSAANGEDPLAGVAQIRIADEAYSAGKHADAIAAYDKAIAILKNDPLAARAKLGRAIAKVQSGKAAEATAELSAIANDATQLKSLRGEAGYHLMSLAVEGGKADEATKLSELLMQIDPMGAWSMRAMQLRASLPAPAAASEAPAATPAVTLPKK